MCLHMCCNMGTQTEHACKQNVVFKTLKVKWPLNALNLTNNSIVCKISSTNIDLSI